MKTPDLSSITGFNWDEGNYYKNWEKHGVSIGECEEIFFNDPFYAYYDAEHSGQENRFYILGQTNKGRRLFIVFTVRRNKIRIISARDMHKKEKKAYEDLKKNTQIQQ